MAGVSRQHMNFIETGRTAATVVVIRTIAETLGLTMGNLLDNVGPRSGGSK